MNVYIDRSKYFNKLTVRLMLKPEYLYSYLVFLVRTSSHALTKNISCTSDGNRIHTRCHATFVSEIW